MSDKTIRIVGIDPSLSSSGLCLLRINHENSVVSKNIKPEKSPADYETRFERYNEIHDQIVKFVSDSKPNLIVIEGYSFGSRGRSMFDLAELGGLIRNSIIGAGHPLIEVSPPRLKKFVYKGNASKDVAHEKMKEEVDFFNGVSQEDQLDAAIASLFGLYLLMAYKGINDIEYGNLDETCIEDAMEHINSTNIQKVKNQHRFWNFSNLC